MKNVSKKIHQNNPGKKHEVLIAIDDMIPDMISNKKLNPVVTEIFIKDRKLCISLVLITRSYFTVLNRKDIRLKSTHYFILKKSNKKLVLKNSN